MHRLAALLAASALALASAGTPNSSRGPCRRGGLTQQRLQCGTQTCRCTFTC